MIKFQNFEVIGAGEGIRTLDPDLGKVRNNAFTRRAPLASVVSCRRRYQLVSAHWQQKPTTPTDSGDCEATAGGVPTVYPDMIRGDPDSGRSSLERARHQGR